MTMPARNVVIPDKMQFPSGGGGFGGGGGGGEVYQPLHRHFFPDERDGFISWLRGEFAAANAIIDSLWHHLRSVGEPGEYDVVIGCIQQRRMNWNPVLHMQTYYSVVEVTEALQQVAMKKQNRHRENRRYGVGFKAAKEGLYSNVEAYNRNGNSSGFMGSERLELVSQKREEAKSVNEVEKSSDKDSASTEEKKDAIAKVHTAEGCNPNSKEKDLGTIQHQNEKNLAISPKTFVATEMFDGKMVNVVDGLKFYEEVFNHGEVSKLLTLVNDMRALGKKGQLQGQTYVVSKRPMKGHGREIIQLGRPVADTPHDVENATDTPKDQRVETIPSMLQDIIERLVGMQVMTVKPDSCVIDIYNEGDYSQPHLWPPWFGRPICVLFLTECEMTFGRVFGIDYPGDYTGSLKLSLDPGSLLSVEGKSTDFARHAIPSIRKQRILVTLIKSQPKKAPPPTDAHRLSSSNGAPSSHWGPPSRPNHIHHPVGHSHYPVPPQTTGVLSVPPVHPQILPQNGIQPMFMPAPLLPQAMPFSSPFPAAPSRHPPPRLLAPGTGVFLPPPGSGNSSSSQQLPNQSSETIPSTVETGSMLEKENGSVKFVPNTTANGKLDGKIQRQDNNGNSQGTGNSTAAAAESVKGEQQLSGDGTVTSKPARAI